MESSIAVFLARWIACVHPPTNIGAKLHQEPKVESETIASTRTPIGMLSLVIGLWEGNFIQSTPRTVVGMCPCKPVFIHPEGVLLLAKCQARATLQST